MFANCILFIYNLNYILKYNGKWKIKRKQIFLSQMALINACLAQLLHNACCCISVMFTFSRFQYADILSTGNSTIIESYQQSIENAASDCKCEWTLIGME